MPVPKPATTIAEQITLLQQRGMAFADIDSAAAVLKHISYYHLGFYWYDLRQNFPAAEAVGDHAINLSTISQKQYKTDLFYQNASFGTVIARYDFDTELQSLVSIGLRQLETSLKTQWIYHFSHKYNPRFYSDLAIYETRSRKGKTVQDIIDGVGNNFQTSTEPSLQTYKDNHPNHIPEAWIIAEILSFGELLYFIAFLKQKDKQDFAHLYAYNPSNDFLKQGEFTQILSQLRVIRNICAHNSWLWNRVFYNFPQLPKKSPLLRASINAQAPQKLYIPLCYLAYLLRRADPKKQWQNSFKSLMQNNLKFSHAMGFPQGWQDTPLWQ